MNNLLKIAQKSPEDFIAMVKKARAKLHWEVQGFGMLRCYLDTKEVRLHIWDYNLRTPSVSTIHTHPWDFTSLVLRGTQTNILYSRDPAGKLYNYSQIKCGMDAHATSEEKTQRLLERSVIHYTVGEYYQEQAHEIHESLPAHHTITLVERHPMADPDHALVYWPHGTSWVDAKPREATRPEVEAIFSSL
jgi:hypothetical protein